MLVNNAGVMHVGPFLEEDDDWTRRQVDVNLHGVILGMKLALPAMVARGSGHVVNVASAAAKIGVPREAVYAASKHAVLGLSRVGPRRAARDRRRPVGRDARASSRTELAAGTRQGRARCSTPEQVARAIVAAIERPRFDVYVPRAYAGLVGAGRRCCPAAPARRCCARPAPSGRPRGPRPSSAPPTRTGSSDGGTQYGSR